MDYASWYAEQAARAAKSSRDPWKNPNLCSTCLSEHWKFPRALRWAGACILIGVGFSTALLLSSYVYSHIYVQGARECEAWYEDESDWGKLPDENAI